MKNQLKFCRWITAWMYTLLYLYRYDKTDVFRHNGGRLFLRRLIFPFFILLLSGGIVPGEVFASANTVEGVRQNTVQLKGTVKDESGETIIGANITVEETTLGTITDVNGNFILSVPNKTITLKASYIGFRDETITLRAGTRNVEIVMKEDAHVLDEVQVVAYGAQKKVSVTGAISAIKGDELLKSPTGSISNVLAGQLTGVSSVQWSGEPGADAADLYIRGITTLNSSAPLIQVDGVEREFTQIDPNEIESISVLKDASATAVFGVRGANGVILITTKRGAEGKAKVSFSTSVGVQVPTKLLEFANSYQYATFYNEAQKNGGVGADSYKFQPDVLEAFRTHSDPVLYPDVDWMDLLLKNGAIQTQHNINISGGVEGVRYFVSLGVFTQEGLFKTFDAGYNFNFNYNRYNYRANLDFDISKTTLLQVNLGGRMESKNTPISAEDQNQLFRHLYWATPFAGAGIVDGRWIKTNSDYISNPGVDGLNPYYGKGYNSRTTNVLNVDIALEQKLDFITKGLTFKLKGAYNTNYWHNKQRSASIAYYTPVKTSDGGIEYMKSGDDGQPGYGESYDKGRNWYAEASVSYNRSFGNHNVGALALYNQSKTYYPSQYSDIPSGYVGLVGRVTYDYMTRYMAEFNMGYNGSENFHPDRRYGFFPAGSLGWVVSEEKFMEPAKKIVNYLKFRASYGIVGNDKYYVNNVQQRFMYIPDSYVIGGDGFNFGTNVSSDKPGAYEGAKKNQYVTWEKAYKQNYGIDAGFADDRLLLSFDFFKEHREDILVQPNTAPGFLAVTLPVLNIGVVDSHGYEIQAKWNDRIGENFRYRVNANLSFSRNKIMEQAEVTPNEDYLWRTGNPVGQRFVYKFWGFYDETANERYKTQYGADIAEHSGGLQNGDCIYVDMNSDGVIDSDDNYPLGYTNNPEYVAGLNLGFNWKGFDFSMQWNGAWNASRLLEETFRQPMGDTGYKGLLLYQYENRWTPETAGTATLPRATLASTKNSEGSDLFLVDASYVRLKNIEIGYNFKLPFFKKAGINDCRVYVNGYNLLTFSSFKWGDPESRTSSRPSYPLTGVYNMGLKIGF